MQNLLLAIWPGGWGASLSMLLSNHEPDVRQLLAIIPDGVALAAHLRIGRLAPPRAAPPSAR